MKRLLVVDDREENLYLLQVLLEGQSYGVDLARNGADALEKARKEPPDLVISDILMPVMDGFTLCREWRADDRLRQVPFVFYTATYTDPTAEQLALDLGADAFITKPAEPEAFVASILDVLGRTETRHVLSPPESELGDESILRQYNETLVRKLEDKMLKLERANEAFEREIAERKQVEQALRESREHYRMLFDAIDEGFCIVEMIFDERERPVDYRYLEVNAAFEKQTELIDAKGKRMRELAPDREDHWFEICGEIALTGKSARFVSHAEQSHRWYDVYAFRIGQPEDRQVGILSSDVTDRKGAEEASQRSHDLLQNLARLVPGVIYQYRLYPDGRSAFPYSSPGMNDIYEVTPEEVREDATPVFGRLHPDDYDYVAGAIAESARTLQTFYCEFRVVLPRQGLRWRWSQAHPERTEDGGTLWHGIISDITERKRAEQDLRESEERYRQMIETAHDWIWEIDERGVYTSSSPKVFELLGYRQEEVLGATPFDFMPSDEAARVAEVFAAIAAGRKPFRDLANVNRHKEGHLVFLETSGMPIFGSSGDFRGYRGVDRDVTERRLAEKALHESEEQLRHSQKMEAVGQLAGGIAHDFNNLLTAVLGYSDLLLAGEELADSAALEDVKEIKHAAERASALTRQILAFSRRQALRPTVVSLNEVLTGMEPLLRRTLGEDIELLSIPDPELGYVEADVHQFEQVVMNLAVNARDAMVVGGRLILETSNVELDQEYCTTHTETTPGSYVMLSVSDTGMGMDPETLDHIFEPFFTTKAVGEGTGLGLATVYGIVRQSRGTISVESVPGKGTRFNICLPRSTQSPGSEETIPPSCVSAPGSETVMVVEDEVALRSLIERILRGLGYTTVTVASAVEALEALEHGECPVDLLLTDVMLPGVLQGHDLARAVLAVRPDLPILFMSGYGRDALAHAGRLEQGVTLLEKPFTPDELARGVRELLDGRAAGEKHIE